MDWCSLTASYVRKNGKHHVVRRACMFRTNHNCWLVDMVWNSLPQLNHLVNSGEVNVSSRFLNLNDSCELGDMPRLSQYCLEANLRNNSILSDTVNNKIYIPLSNYYSGIVVDASTLQWLEASSIPTNQTQNIIETLT